MKLLDHTVTLSGYDGTITLIPFGCVHADDDGFHESLWHQCLHEIRTTPHALAVGLGDYKNLHRTAMREHLRAYTKDRGSLLNIDRIVHKEAERFAKTLEPIRDRLLGLAEGNHYHEFADGTTDTQKLCGLLEVPYLEKLCLIRLRVAAKTGKVHRVIRILVHHGDWSVGYQRVGGDLNAAELKMLGFDFDVYLFSHTHRLVGYISPTLTIPDHGKLRVVERPRAIIKTGCFVRSYVEGCGIHRYPEKRLMHPTNIGYPRLLMRFYRAWDKEKYQEKAQHVGSRAARGNASYPAYKFELRI